MLEIETVRGVEIADDGILNSEMCSKGVVFSFPQGKMWVQNSNKQDINDVVIEAISSITANIAFLRMNGFKVEVE